MLQTRIDSGTLAFGARAPGRHDLRRLAVRSLCATAGLAVLAAAPAGAQTLEDLRSQMEELQRQVETLERQQREEAERMERLERQRVGDAERMRQIEAEPQVASGSEAVKLAISGQVNRALMVVGDGGDTSLLNVDNNASSSRIRAIGEARPMDKVIAGGALEVEFRVNNSFTVSQLDSKSIDDISAFRNRRVEVYFEHEDFGRVWLGQGWTATEFVAEQDLSGTAVAGYSDPRVMGGGMFFRNRDTGELSDIRLLDVVDNMDGFGRDVRIRYDTPRFAGFHCAPRWCATRRSTSPSTTRARSDRSRWRRWSAGPTSRSAPTIPPSTT
jgi:hypothetical protein